MNDIIDTAYEYSIKFHTPNNINDNVTYEIDDDSVDVKVYTVKIWDPTSNKYYDIADDAFFEYYPLGLMPYDYDEYGTKLGDVVKSHIIEVPDGCVISTDDYITLHKLTN